MALQSELHKLPFPERVKRYRELAREAREQAEAACDVDVKSSFVLSADGWDALAKAKDPGAWLLDTTGS